MRIRFQKFVLCGWDEQKSFAHVRGDSHVKRSHVSVTYSIVRARVRFLRVRCGDASPRGVNHGDRRPPNHVRYAVRFRNDSRPS